MNTGGGIVMCMAAAKSASGLIAARFFLSIPDSGVERGPNEGGLDLADTD